jgi:nondiscriminating glutamyl-tRNA synthetase
VPRVRFAPSPTGYLHVGGARTALFNWLYARRHAGTFVLRIEDTDAERSSDEMVAGILSSLRWLGLDWDEGPGVGGSCGPYFQSERVDRHREAAALLVESGRAYYCYCNPDDIAARREAAEKAGGGWVYDRRCLSLPEIELRKYAESGMPRAVRFRVPEGRTAFDDLVRGHIDVDHANIEDFVILRSNGLPTYQLSVVVDDIDMAITDVVRGDDHISNTPKQILLYRALGGSVPRFAHVPLILGPDKKRLSKRHGATSVGEYESQGYLPEAMVNFLALLGWSPGGDREVLTPDEIVSLFALEDISGGNAVFNVEKLDWFNQQHIVRLSADDIARRLALAAPDPATLAAIDLVKPRAKKLADIPPMLAPFMADLVERDPAAAERHLASPDLPPHLRAWRDELSTLEPFDPPALETALRALAAARGIKPGVLIHATRVAVTGQAVSPGIFEVLALVGRERVLRRLDEVLN